MSKSETNGLTNQVMTLIRQKIQQRQLLAGERLPSVRALAQTMKVSPSTVVEAYERLVAEGLIRARRGSGFYVNHSVLPSLNFQLESNQLDREIDPFWVSRQSLDHPEKALLPGCGWMPASWMPEAALRSALRKLARSDSLTLTDYGHSLGDLSLRRSLSQRLAQQGVALDARQLLLCNSATQAIDLICRLLLRPGDTVMLDDPCYFNFRALLRAHQVKVVGVPIQQDGPDLLRFRELLEEHKPRLYLTNSGLHNPTGVNVSAYKLHQILSLSAQANLLIVEDDIFADLETETTPRLASMDGLQRVLRIGSFSKTISASVRCGYIAARSEWIEQLRDLQLATQFGGPSPIACEIVSAVLEGGGYRRHLAELHLRLAKARRDTIQRLQKIGITPWHFPAAGFFIWCQLPEAYDSSLLARQALAHNIVLAPGNVFSVNQNASQFLRFNVTQCQSPELFATLRQLLLHKHN